MPQSSDDLWRAEREVARAQLEQMRKKANGDLAWDTSDSAEHTYLFVPGRVLLNQVRETDFLDVLGRRREFAARDEIRLDDRSTSTLVSYEVPSITGDRALDVRVALGIFDEEMGAAAVTPEHYVHVAVNGGGKSCPATEPAETGVTGPWPRAVDEALGGDVAVVMVDTGWPAGAEEAPVAPYDPVVDGQLRSLEEYDGHGVFAEAVVKCQAPGAIPQRVKFTMQGGAVPELDLANALSKALDDVPTPRVISMSAGCYTYNDQPLKAFEDLWSSKLADMPDTVLVAAAGNDSSPRPFYPAASWWAIGVGSLDFDDRISSFSNYGDSADVFVLGRNHINAFPHGQYVCQWPPDVGGVREFRTGLARWSGTSFSTPLLAGRIAAYLTETHPQGSPTDATLLARELIDGLVDQGFAEPYGNYRYIGRQHWPV